MILVLDTIIDDIASNRFFKSITRVLMKQNKAFDVIRFTKDIDLTPYSHLIISGSELSASKQNPLDEKLYSIIKHFVDNNLPVFGICYGHQMLAKYLAGEKHCRQAKTFEFGISRIEIKPDVIFAGIEKLEVMQSHFDEVCDLSNDFEIIASNSRVEIQGFKQKNKHFYGVQFHPELNYDEAVEMLKRNHFEDERVKDYAVYEQTEKKYCDNAHLMMLNFCKL